MEQEVKKLPWRPREHDREQLVNKLIEWAKLPESINLNKFCAAYEIVPSKLSQWAKEDDYFRQAYEYAKSFLGARREEMLSNETLHVKAYDLNATTYDFFMKEERMEMQKFETEIKKDQEEPIKPEILDYYKSTMQMLKNYQESSLKRESKSINNEQ